MLVLSCQEGESVYINNNVRVLVLKTKGNKVRLAFDAPKDVPVYREKVQERINNEKGIAAPARCN